jgi:hypothetical protein
VNALAQYSIWNRSKQALLERHCLRSRAESLVELLEMKVRIARTPRGRRWPIDAVRARAKSDARRSVTPASGLGRPLASRLPSRPAMVATIFSPWNRPFSMKILLVSAADGAAGEEEPGHAGSNVSGSLRHVRLVNAMPARSINQSV